MLRKNKKRLIMEILFAIAAIAILGYLLQEHAPKILKILESGNAEQIDEYLEQYGTSGRYLLVLLQVIETVSIVLPAAPVYICSGIMFGKLRGILVCYGVNLLLNLIIFLVAGRVGNHTKQHYDITKQKLIGPLVAKAKHMDRVVLLMCLLPIVPNGLIPYLSAQTKVTVPQFIRALAIGSLPSIAVYVCCGDFLMSPNYKVMAPVIVILVVLSAIAFAFRKKLVAFLEPKIVEFIDG